MPYEMPGALAGRRQPGLHVPAQLSGLGRSCVSLVLCLGTWSVIERTRLGSYLRAATENPRWSQAFGINVPRMMTVTYGFGVALAALAGVLAAPIYRVSPLMGADLIIVVFAVVVIGGMGSILGSIVTGFGLGVRGPDQGVLPGGSNTVIFVVMAIVLLVQARRACSEGGMTATPCSRAASRLVARRAPTADPVAAVALVRAASRRWPSIRSS